MNAPHRSAGDPRVGLTLREALVTASNSQARMEGIASLVALADDRAAVIDMASQIATVSRRAAVYYATPEVTYGLAQTAQRLKPEHLVRFYREDFPSPYGLMVFDGDQYPLPHWNGGDAQQFLRAILWAVTPQGLVAWTMVRDETDKEEHMRDVQVGGLHFRQMLVAPWGRQIRVVEISDKDRAESIESDGWPAGDELQTDGIPHLHTISPDTINTFREETVKRYGGRYVPDVSEEEERRLSARTVDAVYRLLYTWVQFVADEIIVPSQVPLNRSERRRAERDKVPETKLNILLLRRVKHIKDGDEEPGEANYSHRFMVAGHWRNQPYGPRDDPEYRAKFISPYIKGPEDRPLIIKDRVIVLGR